LVKFTAVPTGQRWAGCETANGSIGTWELDATSTTVTMMVYKSVISPVGIKMATSYNGTTEIKKNNTKIEWELMTLIFLHLLKAVMQLRLTNSLFFQISDQIQIQLELRCSFVF
jgi:hypothetical protein